MVSCQATPTGSKLIPIGLLYSQGKHTNVTAIFRRGPAATLLQLLPRIEWRISVWGTAQRERTAAQCVLHALIFHKDESKPGVASRTDPI